MMKEMAETKESEKEKEVEEDSEKEDGEIKVLILPRTIPNRTSLTNN